ncbi:N-acetyl sugar amidotransferase [Gordonibacter massiliensis (ex Traore et al. 2017)]|uniref:N-acetyl sugar amidotransferase n=1 Tax=Gordonibacter massiliensis (ex Traore et al. 2017) TaxID=1841863 RepID=A0A842JL79_9ACTN|nr:N-acetyl sugar amidotransferase [Gordonibacter massiliensis (ex Traore et al. 2017)]MBC2889920.1 N-acetyl sugar amidotransferase [Gordonibacter massiliensis (ex Traore et al. 2017)]
MEREVGLLAVSDAANQREYQICANCVMDTSDSMIVFDEKGICDHCHNYYESIEPSWKPGSPEARAELAAMVSKLKSYGEGKDYDCIIGLSGGVDSSYLAYYAKEVLGLRPLLFSCDTGWNLNVAVNNIERIARGLDCELYTEIVNWNEMRDLQLAFFKSQVPYQDIVQDHVIFAALYNFAVKRGIKYTLTGANYSTECVREPNEWVYQNDIRMLKDIHARYGKAPLSSLPLCGMFKNHLYYRYVKGMKAYRPLNLIPYTKKDAIDTLHDKFGWEPYTNKHFESVFTRFYEGYWLIEKFGYDKRRAHFSSLILTGQMTREEALSKLAEPAYDPKLAQEDMEYVAKKLGLTKAEFEAMMSEPNKTYRDYKNQSGMIAAAVKVAQLVGMEKRNYR